MVISSVCCLVRHVWRAPIAKMSLSSECRVKFRVSGTRLVVRGGPVLSCVNFEGGFLPTLEELSRVSFSLISLIVSFMRYGSFR